jgi:hypothetical protein
MQEHDTQSLEQRLIALCERIATARNLTEVNVAAGETLNELRGVNES